LKSTCDQVQAGIGAGERDPWVGQPRRNEDLVTPWTLSVLKKLQEQFPLGGDVKLLIDPRLWFLSRADGDAEAPGFRRRVAGEISWQVALAQWTVSATAYRDGRLLRGEARAGRRPLVRKNSRPRALCRARAAPRHRQRSSKRAISLVLEHALVEAIEEDAGTSPPPSAA